MTEGLIGALRPVRIIPVPAHRDQFRVNNRAFKLSLNALQLNSNLPSRYGSLSQSSILRSLLTRLPVA